MDKKIELSKNRVVSYLKKPANEFTRKDIIRFIVDNDIEMVNFMYPAADGRLKTLNFVITSLEYLETILTLGERVDGSSLFPFISAGSSDLYVIPRVFCRPVRGDSDPNTSVLIFRQRRSPARQFTRTDTPKSL